MWLARAGGSAGQESQTLSYAVGVQPRRQLKDTGSILSSAISSVKELTLTVPQFPHL